MIQLLEYDFLLKVKWVFDLEDSFFEFYGRDVVDEGDYKVLRKKVVSLE